MIAPPVQLRLSQRLLGAHVVRRPDLLAGPCQRRTTGALLPLRDSADHPRDPEVRHHGVSGLQQDVLRLDVAMDHTPLVRVVQRVGHLPRDMQCVLERQLPVAQQTSAQRLTLDVRHDVVEHAGRFPGVVHREDVGVIERGGDLDLALEALRSEPRGEFGSDHLDGHSAAVLQVLGEMNRRHPPFAQAALQPVT